MANKFKTLILGTALTLSALVSCKDSVQEPEQQESQQPKTEVKAKPKTEQQIRYEYYMHVRDSIENVNGAKSYSARYATRQSLWADENDIYEMTYDYSLGGVMDREVATKGTRIIETSYNQIVAELARYNVSLDEYISQDSLNFYAKKFCTDNKSRIVDYTSGISKYDLCFIGVDQESQDPEYFNIATSEWNDLVETIEFAIDVSTCDEIQRNNMKTTVNRILAIAKNNLIASRKAVEQKYADYMQLPEDFKNSLGISYEGEGSYAYGYGDVNYYNTRYVNTRRYISVYDSKLTMDFFTEKGATFKLVSVGTGKWQVIKQSANGTITRTHVFEDNKTAEDYYVFTDEPLNIGEVEFRFTKGGNFGVHVSSDEVISNQRRKKDFVMRLPANIQHTVDSLNQEINDKRKIEDDIFEAYRLADSIADAMTEQKFGPER